MEHCECAYFPRYPGILLRTFLNIRWSRSSRYQRSVVYRLIAIRVSGSKDLPVAVHLCLCSEMYLFLSTLRRLYKCCCGVTWDANFNHWRVCRETGTFFHHMPNKIITQFTGNSVYAVKPYEQFMLCCFTLRFVQIMLTNLLKLIPLAVCFFTLAPLRVVTV